MQIFNDDVSSTHHWLSPIVTDIKLIGIYPTNPKEVITYQGGLTTHWIWGYFWSGTLSTHWIDPCFTRVLLKGLRPGGLHLNQCNPLICFSNGHSPFSAAVSTTKVKPGRLITIFPAEVINRYSTLFVTTKIKYYKRGTKRIRNMRIPGKYLMWCVHHNHPHFSGIVEPFRYGWRLVKSTFLLFVHRASICESHNFKLSHSVSYLC